MRINNKIQQEILVLERILSDSRASREKKMLAMIGLVNMAKQKGAVNE